MLRPDLAVQLRPLYDFTHHATGVVALASDANWCAWVFTSQSRLRLAMTHLNNSLGNLAKQCGVRRHEALAMAVRWQHAATDGKNLLFEEVVEDTITA